MHKTCPSSSQSLQQTLHIVSGLFSGTGRTQSKMASNLSGQRELTQRFKVQKFLGKGSYGSVYRVKRISDGKVYALKETDVKHMSQQVRFPFLPSISHFHVINHQPSVGRTCNIVAIRESAGSSV